MMGKSKSGVILVLALISASQIFAQTLVRPGRPPRPSQSVVIATPFVFDGAVGLEYKYNLAAVNGTAPLTWTLAAGALPPGISLSASGVLSGTPTQVGAFQFTVRAASGALATPGTRAYTMQILAADPWIGKWAGVIDQPGRRPDVSVTPLIASGGSSTLYTFFMGQGYVCNVTLTAPGSLSFSGYCSNGWDDQAISGSRSGTSITAVLEPSFSATLPSGNMTLNKLP